MALQFSTQAVLRGAQRIMKPSTFVLPGIRCYSATAGSKRVLPGEISPRRSIPEGIPMPPYAKDGSSIPPHPEPEQHTAKSIAAMKKACLNARDVLAFAGTLVKPGVTTDEIDRKVHFATLSRGIYPSPFNYAHFPKSLCTSVNEVVCHGIPDNRPLEEGDIVSLDVSCFVDGYHGDTCRTFIAGEGNEKANELVRVTKECLDEAIKVCGPGEAFNVIGNKIGEICSKAGFESVRAFTGHGIGSVFHTKPLVFHYPNSNPEGYTMRPGMTFTIEPMIVEGSNKVRVWRDGWTVVTADAGRAAQFEHTLLVTEDGIEILTDYEQSNPEIDDLIEATKEI